MLSENWLGFLVVWKGSVCCFSFSKLTYQFVVGGCGRIWRLVTSTVTEMVLILFLLTRPCSMQLHPTFMVEPVRYGCCGFSYVLVSFQLSLLFCGLHAF